MREENIESLRLLARSALPIDNIASITIPASNDGIGVVWVDLSERPDLVSVIEQSAQDGGHARMDWFYRYLGRRDMSIGMRIEMEYPTKTVLALMFEVEKYIEWLSMVARHGKIWILPGPIPEFLVGRSRDMHPDVFMERVGQGLLMGFDSPSDAVELRSQLAQWEALYHSKE